MNKTFYLTTAIDYVNGEPHLGHGYEKVIADVIARSQRSLGKDVFFLTGLDEHGQKVQQAAVSEGKTPQAYCDELAGIWKQFASNIHLSQNHFVRTTDESHVRLVQDVLNQLKTAGHLYQAEYRGFYSTREETFLTEKDRRPDGTFDPAYGEVTELVEENYYFKLKNEQQWLIDYIEKNPDFVYPDSRRNEVLGFLKSNPLEDLCVTRPAARLNWGIPLPFDSDFVTYVWFDALLNYISVPAAYGDPLLESIVSEKQTNRQTLWPADLHIIGKDIIKFHAVYWPILLKALGLPLPKKILVHGWWQKDGKRMSKSLGNGVDPIEVINEWGVDAFRYYVIRELDIGPDGNWTTSGFRGRYDAELANGLGNLVNRSLSMLKRYRQGVVPQRADELKADADQAVSAVRRLLETYHLQEALGSIWGLVNRANLYVEQTAPFRLAKEPAQSKRLDEVLYNLVECTRILALLLWPFLPSTAEKIFQQLSLTPEKFHFDGTLWGGLPEKHLIGEPQPLFPRKDLVPKK